MKKLTVETLIPKHFKYVARDLNGAIFAFQNKPGLTTDIACDTWDVKAGDVLQITVPILLSVEEVDLQLGDWKNSLINLKT
jgi:hypothetical protein